MKTPNQINLILAIAKELTRQGFGELNTRQFNAVIEAANSIITEIGKPHVTASDNSGLVAWLLSDDTGMSSKAMARHLAPIAGVPGHGAPINLRVEDRTFHPLDPADFGRCYRLLEAVPELRPHLPLMAELSPTWGRLVGAWGELEALYRKELPSGKAPKLYKRMQELIDETQS